MASVSCLCPTYPRPPDPSKGHQGQDLPILVSLKKKGRREGEREKEGRKGGRERGSAERGREACSDSSVPQCHGDNAENG